MNFLKVGIACPKLKVANIEYNIQNIFNCIEEANNSSIKFLVFPELSITSSSCGDLFLNTTLQEKTLKGINYICSKTKNLDMLIAIGGPLLYNDKLYNCAFVLHKGKVLGIVPKSSNSHNMVFFNNGDNIINMSIDLSFQKYIPFSSNLIFKYNEIKFAVEISNDFFGPISKSSMYCQLGATIIGNLSCKPVTAGSSDLNFILMASQSKKAHCAYLYSSSGVFESSTDLCYDGHMCIYEDGVLLKENNRFQRKNEIISEFIDISYLMSQRVKDENFISIKSEVKNEVIFNFDEIKITNFDREISPTPFLDLYKDYYSDIFNLQCSALAKRLSYVGAKKVVIGISGGLDSTIALLSTINAFYALGLSRKNIISVTLPGFGTSDRTYNNAISLIKEFDTDFREIDIKKSCIQHFSDINQDINVHDVTFENAQARERTQILMDIANKENALLLGTGDLSEIALGWCTYNGDHMSMYNLNATLPKTLIKELVAEWASSQQNSNLYKILMDIVNTPVSPELLPKTQEEKLNQETEKIVGPYELHDFFLFYFIEHNASYNKIFFLAKKAFEGTYTNDEIKYWLNIFIKRFFTSQFKRSASPDGPKILNISLSPRDGLHMPSDASYNSFL